MAILNIPGAGGAGSGAPTDATYVTTAAESGLSAESVLGTSVIQSGTTAARPAASAVAAGTLYFATDTAGGTLYRSNATVWAAVGVANTRPQALAAGLSIGGETVPIQVANGVQIGVSGTVYGIGIPLLAGDVVTNLISYVSTGGASGTLTKLGLYSGVAAPVLLASTADVKVAYQSTGYIISALSAPYTVTTTGLYYIAIISVGGTIPTLQKVANATTTYIAIGAGVVRGWQQGSQTDLPNPATPANIGFSYWHAWS